MRKKRYILGEGYPWAMGVGPEYREVALKDGQVGGTNIPLAWPAEFWKRGCPKVRLVMEVI